MIGVDIGCDFEYETCELLLLGVYHALLGLCGARTGGYLHETVEKFLDSEIVKCRTEKHWSYLGFPVRLDVKLRINAINKFKVVAQLCGISLSYMTIQLIAIDVYLHFFGHTLLVGCEKIEFTFIYIVNTLELYTLIDRPTKRSDFDFQFLLQFIKQVKRVASFTVHLIDEDDDWCVTHSAYSHEFACLSLHTLCTIYDNNG